MVNGEATYTSERIIEVGDYVVFFDAVGNAHEALVTSVFALGDRAPSVNIVYVSSDPEAHDQYGRQTARETSVVHKTNQAAPGMYWRRLDEL